MNVLQGDWQWFWGFSEWHAGFTSKTLQSWCTCNLYLEDCNATLFFLILSFPFLQLQKDLVDVLEDVTLYSVILIDRSVPVPTDLFWGESSRAKTIAHVDINTHRTTSCQETVKTSKIPHKHKGVTLENMQKESNCGSCVLNTHSLISANKSDI